MKEIQKLVENYWTAVHTENTDMLNQVLAEDIKTILFFDNEKKVEFNSREELIGMAVKVGRTVREVFEITKKYTFSNNNNEIMVQFSHYMGLNTNSLFRSKGSQYWTTKIVDGKMVLASLTVHENSVAPY